MKKVAIFLSVYNGAKYLKQQIESILNQDYSNIELLIRDDGSTDESLDIIKSFNDERINIIEDDKGNLGYPAGFYELIKQKPIADYYAFADQDDVWKTSKISRAIEKLSKYENEVVAYYAGYDVCDSQLNVLSVKKYNCEFKSFSDVLFDVPGLEFTCVFTKRAYDLLLENLPKKVNARGTWMALLFAGAGKIIVDNYSCAYYRRHESVVTSQNIGSYKIYLDRLKKVLSGEMFVFFKDLFKEFSEVCYQNISKENLEILNLFANKGHRIKKVFFSKRLREKMIDEILLRVAMLIGQI